MIETHISYKLAYSVDEAAEILGIGRTFAFKLIADGDLGSIKSDIVAWWQEPTLKRSSRNFDVKRHE